MRYVSAAATNRDLERARQVLVGRPLPPGISGFELEPDGDQDGDPVIWVWLDFDETGWRSGPHADPASEALDKLRHDLEEVLEDYRPHLRFRALTSRHG